jgi:hypothetical protein
VRTAGHDELGPRRSFAAAEPRTLERAPAVSLLRGLIPALKNLARARGRHARARPGPPGAGAASPLRGGRGRVVDFRQPRRSRPRGSAARLIPLFAAAWLLAAPTLFDHDAAAVVVHAAAGALLVALSLWTRGRPPLRVPQAALGTALVLAPFAFDYAGAARLDGLVVGALLVAAAIPRGGGTLSFAARPQRPGAA